MKLYIYSRYETEVFIGLVRKSSSNHRVGYFIIDEWSILRTVEIHIVVAVIWNGGTRRDACRFHPRLYKPPVGVMATLMSTKSYRTDFVKALFP